MAVATSMGQLVEMIMAQMVAAMSVVRSLSEVDMDVSIGEFYAGGTPVMYARTGQLKSTPRTTGLARGGKSVMFTAYLNQGGGYSTGKCPSMATILQHTNYGAVQGLRPAVGSPGYWEKAEMRIKRDLDSTFASFFG